MWIPADFQASRVSLFRTTLEFMGWYTARLLSVIGFFQSTEEVVEFELLLGYRCGDVLQTFDRDSDRDPFGAVTDTRFREIWEGSKQGTFVMGIHPGIVTVGVDNLEALFSEPVRQSERDFDLENFQVHRHG